MKVKRRSNTTFTTDQENFIVSQFHQGFSPVQVRRNFTKKYGFSTEVRKLQPHQFSRVFKRFKKNDIAQCSSSGQPKKSIENPKYSKIEAFYNENPKASLNDGFKKLKVPKSTLRWVLKNKFGLKWFQDRYGQVLTPKHKGERFEMCEWLLTLPDELLLSIIFGDEKWFVLEKLANRKNIGTWATVNPHVMKDFKSKERSQSHGFLLCASWLFFTPNLAL